MKKVVCVFPLVFFSPVRYRDGVMEHITYRVMLSEAWRRTRSRLFQPFELTTWFVLGFSAWLAALGEQGGSFNFNFPITSEQPVQPRELLQQVMHFVSAHPLLISISAGTGLTILAVITVLVLWLSSRGKCMFLENLITRRPTVQDSWRNQRERGRSLFLWRLMYTVVTSLILLCFAAGAFFLVLPCWLESTLLPIPLLFLALLAFVLLAVLLLMAVITTFLNDFVIPIMLLHNETAVQAWHSFIQLFGGRAWSFVAYLFVRTGLVVVIGLTFLLVFLLTCCLFCIGGLLLIIPYIGTVLLLPYYVFMRYFTLEFLASHGPEWILKPCEPATGNPVEQAMPEG